MVMHIERAQIDELLERIPDTIDLDIEDNAACRDLSRWLELTLRSELGFLHIAREDNGDIPIPLGDSVIHVHHGDGDAQFVTVSAVLLSDVEPTAHVYEAVNGINVQTPLAKTMVLDDRIVTSVDLEVVDTLSPQDLMLAVEVVGRVIEQFGGRLLSRFGAVDA